MTHLRDFRFAKSLTFPIISRITLGLLAFATVAPHDSAAAPQDTGANVVLLTLDGVRWKEVFQGVDEGQSADPNPRIFDFLLNTLAKQGPLLGDKRRGDSVEASNPSLKSLPGYQSIMAGANQPCRNNNCGRIRVETFPERILHDLELKKEQVVTIASWERIANAVEHVEGTTLVNAGQAPLKLPEADPEAEAINRQQQVDSPPWSSARYDKYTFAHAMNYLKKHQPRFLFIGLNDSDEWGHKSDYSKYVATLRQQDAWIKELVSTLDSMGDYGKRTTLIITTDHGRGKDNDWSEHGAEYAGSDSVWIYGRGPKSRGIPARGPRSPSSRLAFSHLDIRPTVEATFGLEPKLDGVTPPPGKVIRSIVGR